MAGKDELYDPPVKYDTSSDEELNNSKDPSSLSPPPSPLDNVLIHNDLRKGGPLADPNWICQNPVCNHEVQVGEKLCGGNAYGCSTNPKRPADWANTHRFCEGCANKGKCPICGAIKLTGAYRRPPNVIAERKA